MPIVLVRVDERLIHGQVLEVWVPATRAEELLVANDAVAGDDAQRMIMELAIPNSMRVVIDRVEKIAALLRNGAETNVRRMVVIERPQDALTLKKAGVNYGRLNLGNLTSRQATMCLSRSVSVGTEDLDALRNLVSAGVDVTIQSVPCDKPVGLKEIFRTLKGARFFPSV
jgi:sorbose PTS system EIIB component